MGETNHAGRWWDGSRHVKAGFFRVESRGQGLGAEGTTLTLHILYIDGMES